MRTTLRCTGCGAVAPPASEAPYPFRCLGAAPGDDIDHVLSRSLDAEGLAFPAGDEANPFERYRVFFHSYHVAREGGLSDEVYLEIVRDLDARVADVAGRGFAVTPFFEAPVLGAELGCARGGAVWVKDETGTPGDSHKARHLMGLALYLAVIDELGLSPPGAPPPLAVASCGNAAYAAAVIARAINHKLRVFVPPDVEPDVEVRLSALGAERVYCPREAGEAGDPCVRRFRSAVAEGALAFACQGSEAGLTLDGGATIGHEIAGSGARVDRVFVQVGGGALASSVARGLEDAKRLGKIERMPRFYAVQTRAVAPLRRAWELAAARIIARAGGDPSAPDAERAARIREVDPSLIEEELAFAARRRSAFMWPWERASRSLARAILDDETYDWLAIVRMMLLTGGRPILVDEPELELAHSLARGTTGVPVGPSGSAGLAGVIELLTQEPEAAGDKIAVIFSGTRG